MVKLCPSRLPRLTSIPINRLDMNRFCAKAEFATKSILHPECCDQSENAPCDEVLVSTIRVSGWIKACASEVPSAKSEIRIENPHIECEPNRVENVLHGHTVRAEAEVGVQELPCKIQRQCIKRNRVSLVAK